MNDNNNTHFINLNQTMRQVRLLPVLLLTLLLSSCNDTLLIKDVGTKEQGALSLNLSMDSGTLMSKADGTDGGEMTAQDTLDNFKVEIYRKVSDNMKDGIRLYMSMQRMTLYLWMQVITICVQSSVILWESALTDLSLWLSSHLPCVRRLART